MVRRAITLGEGGSATASFHRCAAIRESQRRHRANYFVDGVTESLTTDLPRISDSFVVGRHTAFACTGEAFDLKKIKRALKVPYLLRGSVPRGGSRPRMSEPFVDAESGRHLFSAERTNNVIAAEYIQAVHFSNARWCSVEALAGAAPCSANVTIEQEQA